MSDKLEPCPNRECGSDGALCDYEYTAADGYQFFIACGDCGVRGPRVESNSEASCRTAAARARAAWNALPRAVEAGALM